MATSAKKEVTCGYNGHYHLYMTITAVKQEIANNRTYVSVKMYAKSDSSSYGAYNLSSSANTSKMTVDGTQVVNKTMAMDFRGMATVNLAEWEGWITHDAKGAKKLTCSGSFTISGSSYLSGGNISCEIDLDDIPRATKPTLSVQTIELGKTLTIGIAPAVSTWKHKIYYWFGSGSWTGVNYGATDDYDWTIPVSVASNLPNATSGTMTIGVKTYSDSGMTKQIGTTQTINVKVTVPASVIPAISSVTVAEAGTGLSGSYVQGKSAFNLKTVAAGIHGSAIKTIKHKIGSTTYTADDDWTSGVVSLSGTVAIVTTVTDSRGRSASKTTNVTVYEYSPPRITQFACQRCDSNGTLNKNGTCSKITSAFDVSPVNNKNANAYKIEYKKSTDTAWTSLTAGNAYSYNQSYISDAVFSVASTYDVRLTVTDSFTSSDASDTVTSAFRLLSYIIKKSALAIGKIAEIANTLEIALDTKFRNTVTFESDVYDSDGNNFILKAYPIGSIYMSVNSTNPKDLFGGTWVAWGSGRVPVGVNTSDTDFNAAGKTGGEKTHKLTTNEMPKHNHTPRLYHNQNYNNRKLPAAVIYSLWSTATKYTDTEINGNWGIGGFTDDVGSDVAHNNLQPYITCYMWKRTA